MGASPIETRDHRIRVTAEEAIHVVELYGAGPSRQPAIISLHGTGGAAHGTRRWRLRLGRQVAEHGFRFYLFDSRGHAYSDGEYEDATVTRFVEDANAVLRWVRNQENVDESRIGLFGFSLGSAVSVIIARKHHDWIKALVVYTLPCDMSRNYLWYFERFATGSLDSFFSSKSGRTWLPEIGEYLNRTFLDDLANHHVEEDIRHLRMPMLLMQPTDDDQVPNWISHKMYDLKPQPKRRCDIDGTHTMKSKKNEWIDAQEEQVTQEALKFFHECL